MLTFSKLTTPPGDGKVLIEPAAADWLRLLERNIQQFYRQNITLAGRPVAQVRREVRAGLGATDPSRPILATGHQPEFVHPGVWAKCVVTRHMADRLGGVGIDLVVDNDTPRSNTLDIPTVGADGLIEIRSIGFYQGATGAAYEGRAPLAVKIIETLARDVGDALPSPSAITDYLAGLKDAANAADMVDQHLAGRRIVDAPLSADLREVRVSRVFGGPFLADLLLEAERFAVCYNRALASYRCAGGIRDPNRPLPDLAGHGSRVETAFWIYQPGGRRCRLWVERTGTDVELFADAEKVARVSVAALLDDPDAVLRSLAPWVVRPRALTLTLWARLLACDLFVHGIGGAKYDRITDGIFRSYYACPPPAYVCVTATLRLPLPRQAVERSDVLAARRRLRDLHFNPDRYIENLPEAVLRQRTDWIEQSRRQRAARAPSEQRRETFLAIRTLHEEIVKCHPEAHVRLREQWALLERKAASNALADSREYFYALHPPARLRLLADRLIDACR